MIFLGNFVCCRRLLGFVLSVFVEVEAEPLTGDLLLLSDVKLIPAIFSMNLFQPTGSALVSLADSGPFLSNLDTNLVALEFSSVS